MTDTFYALLENPPEGCEAVAQLWHWSLNYDPGKGPATLFLDLVGWSQDELGEALYSLSGASLGYRELEELHDALGDYVKDPQGVRDYVQRVICAEGE